MLPYNVGSNPRRILIRRAWSEGCSHRSTWPRAAHRPLDGWRAALWPTVNNEGGRHAVGEERHRRDRFRCGAEILCKPRLLLMIDVARQHEQRAGLRRTGQPRFAE